MSILIIYDSVFGNTEKTAQGIGAALGSRECRDAPGKCCQARETGRVEAIDRRLAYPAIQAHCRHELFSERITLKQPERRQSSRL